MVNGNPESGKNAVKLPSPWVSVLPLAVLTLLLYVVIRCFGGDAITAAARSRCCQIGRASCRERV